MRYIHQDALAIHFADDFFAEIRQAIVRRLVGGGIRPLVVVEMRQGHVAHAQIGEDPHDADIVADHVAALHTHQCGNLTVFVRTANVFRSSRQGHVFRILPDVLAHCVDLVQRFLHRLGPHDASVDPDREENRVHPTFAHARDIDVPVGIAFGDVVGIGEKTLRGVVVGIQDDRG